MITVTKGISIGEIEREWVALGGTVVRDRPGHALFKFPGLAAAGVHAAHTADSRAPRHLVSRFLKLKQGRINAPRPVNVTPAPVVEQDFTRVRFAERPWPEREISLAPLTPESYAAVLAVCEALKVARLARVVARQAPRVPTEEEIRAAVDRVADEKARQWVREIARAEVIVGEGFRDTVHRGDYGRPGLMLVFYGTDKLDAYHQGDGAEPDVLSIDLSGATPAEVDAHTFHVFEIKGHSDMLFSSQWGRGINGTSDAIRGHVSRLKQGAVVGPAFSIAADSLLTAALDSARGNQKLDLSDGLHGLGIEKVMMDRGYYPTRRGQNVRVRG